MKIGEAKQVKMLNIDNELHFNIEEKLQKIVTRLIVLDDIDNSLYENMTVKEQQRIGFFSRDFGMEHWDWPQGVGIFGLAQFGNKYNDYIKCWAENEIRKGLPLPNINTVCPLLTLVDFPEYEEISLSWANKIVHQFNRTDEDGLQHDTTGSNKNELTIKENELWADTVFMAVLFLIKIGKKYDNQMWIDEAIYQMHLHVKMLLDKESGLFCHGWDYNRKDNFGTIFGVEETAG